MKKVLIGGVFDLLHLGHIRALKKAKGYGDYLIVNISSDERVRIKKGNGRPILPAKDRAEIVSELRFVDEVVLYEGETEPNHFRACRQMRPDILIMDDNEHQDLSREKMLCKELGIELVRMPRVITESELDTTKIIEKINNNV